MADTVKPYGGDKPGDYGGDVWAKSGAAKILDAIVGTMNSVPDVGPVHRYERTSRSPAKFLELMRDGINRTNGWTVRRRSTASRRGASNIVIERVHVFEINAMFGPVDDLEASEETFQGILESIYQAFRVDYTLGGACLLAGQVQIEDVDLIEFHGTLYHFAALSLEATERDYAQ